MARFSGVKRRFQLTGTWNGVAIYDDYGHHPVEIAAVLKAARAGARGRVIAVVEPHRYTRVRDLFDEFAACFKDADSVIVTPLYSAGEPPIDGIDHRSLAEAIRATGHKAVAAVDSERDIAPMLQARRRPGDMVVCLGAGNSTEWAHALPDWLAGERRARREGRCELSRPAAASSRAALPELRGRLLANAAARRHHLVPRRRAGAGAVHAGRRGRPRLFPARIARPSCPCSSSASAPTCWCATAACRASSSASGAASPRSTVEPGHRLRAGTAVPDVKLARAAADAGIAGLAFYRGIPGSIGGALRMNAGAHGRETKDVLVEARAVDRQGNMHVLSLADMRFTYRHCGVPRRLDLHRGALPGHARRPGRDPASRWTRSPSIARPTSRSRSAPAAPPSRTRPATAPGS